MITGPQIRAARGLLRWSAIELADKAGVSRATINNIEEASVQPRAKSLEDIVRVLEEEGIEFIGDRGVAQRDDQVVTLHGENVFVRLLDDVIATLRKAKKPEALFACVDDKQSPPLVVENYRRLRKAGIAMRSLVKEGNTYLMGKLTEYRYLPAAYFRNNALVIYGDKLATMILDPKTGEDESALIIHNPHVAAAQRNLFNLIWANAAKPHKTTAEVRYDD
jgi:transcriptional regulator with XRE-family HTH domain